MKTLTHIHEVYEVNTPGVQVSGESIHQGYKQTRTNTPRVLVMAVSDPLSIHDVYTLKELPGVGAFLRPALLAPSWRLFSTAAKFGGHRNACGGACNACNALRSAHQADPRLINACLTRAPRVRHVTPRSRPLRDRHASVREYSWWLLAACPQSVRMRRLRSECSVATHCARVDWR